MSALRLLPGDALVLDLDHCIVRYRVGALQKLIYACLVRAFVERGVAPLEAFLARPAGSFATDDCVCGAAAADAAADAAAAADVALMAAEEASGEGADDAVTSLGALDATDEAKWGAAWTPCFAQKGLIYDTPTGDILQLSADGHVARAWHGLEPVSAADVAARHGAGVWRGHATLLSRSRDPDASVFLTYFDAPAVFSLAQLVSWADARGEGGVDAYRRAISAHSPVFDYIFDNQKAWATGRGGFFAALRARPSNYFLPRTRLHTALQRLRTRGALVVIATNSHVDFARLALRTVFGAQWRKCFSAIFYDSAKPSWFVNTCPVGNADDARALSAGGAAALPELPPHGTAPMPLRGPPLEHFTVALGTADVPAVELVNGSAILVDALVKSAKAAQLNSADAASATVRLDANGVPHPFEDAATTSSERSPQPRIVFAGDHLHTDVAASAARGWTAVAIVEELSWDATARDFRGEFSADPAPSGAERSAHWDGFFSVGEGGTKPSHWAAVLGAHASEVVSDLCDFVGSL